jgi:hypothetical protein
VRLSTARARPTERTRRIPPELGVALALAAVAGLAALAGFGGGEEPETSTTVAAADRARFASAEAKGVGEVRALSTAQFANCSDWRGGSEAERYATIEDIRGQLTPQSSTTAASDLPDEEAYEIFEGVCANDYSDALRLYKLYARAQAFAPLRGSD